MFQCLHIPSGGGGGAGGFLVAIALIMALVIFTVISWISQLVGVGMALVIVLSLIWRLGHRSEGETPQGTFIKTIVTIGCVSVFLLVSGVLFSMFGGSWYNAQPVVGKSFPTQSTVPNTGYEGSEEYKRTHNPEYEHEGGYYPRPTVVQPQTQPPVRYLAGVAQTPTQPTLKPTNCRELTEKERDSFRPVDPRLTTRISNRTSCAAVVFSGNNVAVNQLSGGTWRGVTGLDSNAWAVIRDRDGWCKAGLNKIGNIYEIRTQMPCTKVATQ